MIRALLIDDEPSARADLRERLAVHPEVALVGEAGTLAHARALLRGAEYELVFLDAQLRGGRGFDLVPLLRVGARIVFVTASEAHALRAIQANALDFLLKPVAADRLAASLLRFAAHPPPAPTSVRSALVPDDHILLRTDLMPRLVRIRDISVILAEGNYTEVALVDGACHFVRRTLATWSALLPSASFARVHRRALVNLQHVKRVAPVGVEGVLLHLAGIDAPIPASRRQWPELRLRLACVRAASTR